MLTLMKTPAEVAPEQATYLRIYFAGVIGLLLYNMGSGILRAVGDSRRPFYFLVVSAVLNTVLDLLFVIKFHMGVEGVAYATIIAQAVSAVLTLWVLMGAEGGIRLELRALRFTWSVLRQIVALIPAAYLLSLTGDVGNVWWCFPIAEVMSALATAFFLRRALRDMDRQLTLAEGQ